ncbi:hypothetical protein [uncultured Bradyrhizobium sp.]|jgi:uncharacterized protein YutE (UPF0331/DUF86 family)|uniref:hypothetical protein n=1 Tax=uncultured Bradyrhizobium sp. TaxID=199684 RepID=UPI0026373A09|nr:hypothetical protein [uncultured Bradyrhizobium sp.]
MIFPRVARLALLVLFAIALPGAARAGGDISFEREYRRIIEVENQVMAQPAYQESKDLIDQIGQAREYLSSVEKRYEEAAATDGPEPIYSREVAKIQARLNRLERRLAELTKTLKDVREAAEGASGGRIFGRAANRTAVFTYEDPQATGLGDAVAYLISKKLLFTSPVQSFAVVNFRGEQLETPVGPDRASRSPTYFDKVDLVTQNQNFGLAVWGRITRAGAGISIDSFLQVPASASREKLGADIRLPKAMGGATLSAHLKSDRVLVSTTDLEKSSAENLKRAARQVSSLRRQPKASAAVVAKLEGLYRIVGRSGSWVELQLSDGRRGWTSVDEFCSDECAFLLKAADFTNDILAQTAGAGPRRLPEGFTRDAEEMSKEFATLRLLQDQPEKAADLAESWIKNSKTRHPKFESLLALARLQIALKRETARGRSYEDIRLEPQVLQPIVDTLVEASIANPSDDELLRNLAKLFNVLGDSARADLASQLADRVVH